MDKGLVARLMPTRVYATHQSMYSVEHSGGHALGGVDSKESVELPIEPPYFDREDRNDEACGNLSVSSPYGWFAPLIEHTCSIGADTTLYIVVSI